MNIYVKQVKNVFQKLGYVMVQLIVELVMILMKLQIVVCSHVFYINISSSSSSSLEQEHCDLNSGRYFQCADSQECLPISSKCDSHKDCADGSDERGCACTCSEQFSCETICQCLNISRVCDGIPDCIDQTDENNCTCTSNEYSCLGGGCINRTQLCDGMVNCPKGDDETYPDCIGKFYSLINSI
jgi:hypothetical protein